MTVVVGNVILDPETGAPNGALVAANDLSDVSNASASRANLGLGTIATQDAGAVSITGGSVTVSADPTGTFDVATKQYVDTLVSGIKWKAPVRVATTTNGTLATAYANGQTVDGVVLVTGDRILLKDQTAATDNGIYTVNASGAPTRSTDANTGPNLVSASVFVSAGTANADKAFVCTTNSPITIGVTNIAFVEFSFTGSALTPTNNLSDLTNNVTARSNLGLAPIAASGSAADLTSGTISAARLPAFALNRDSKGGDIASSPTITPTQASSFYHITGTATISYLTFTGFQDGNTVELYFVSALVLKHNDSSPGGAAYPIKLVGADDASMGAGSKIRLRLDIALGLWVEMGRAST